MDEKVKESSLPDKVKKILSRDAAANPEVWEKLEEIFATFPPGTLCYIPDKSTNYAGEANPEVFMITDTPAIMCYVTGKKSGRMPEYHIAVGFNLLSGEEVITIYPFDIWWSEDDPAFTRDNFKIQPLKAVMEANPEFSLTSREK